MIEEIKVNLQSIHIEDQSKKISRENSVENNMDSKLVNAIANTTSSYSEDQDFDTIQDNEFKKPVRKQSLLRNNIDC